MAQYPVWDPFVRVFHWSLAGLFVANTLFIDPDSSLHSTIGYLVIGLVSLRLIWGLVGTPYARFSSFPISAQAALDQLRDIALSRRFAHRGHSPLGALMIYNLLFSILGLGLSGYLTTLGAGQGFGFAEDLHETLAVWTQFSIALHIGAVFFESRRIRVDLIRAMITGVKNIPRHRVRE